jgi:hypothetical protein
MLHSQADLIQFWGDLNSGTPLAWGNHFTSVVLSPKIVKMFSTNFDPVLGKPTIKT